MKVSIDHIERIMLCPETRMSDRAEFCLALIAHRNKTHAGLLGAARQALVILSHQGGFPNTIPMLEAAIEAAEMVEVSSGEE